MKCPNCHNAHPYREGMTCRCGYQFVLNPKTDSMSDGKFMAVINQASRGGTYYFTRDQLYTEFCRKIKQPVKTTAALFFLALAAWIIGLVSGQGWLAWVGGILTVIFSLGLLGLKLTNIVAGREKFAALLHKFTSVHKIPKMLEKTGLQQPPPEWPEKDIFDYGVERILVVQHDILVDLFVRNGFYADKSCLVVSAAGYPAYLARRCKEIIKENKMTSIFLLHDATREGAAMVNRFVENNKSSARKMRILDVGIDPEAVRLMVPLRILKPAQKGFALPADALPYAYLSNLLGVSMDTGLSFRQLLINRDEGLSDGVSGGDSYG